MAATAVRGGQLLCACAVLVAVISGPPRPSRGAETSAEAEKAPVALDRLLVLPKSLQYDADEKGGHTRGEWRARFDGLRAALAREEEELEAAQERRQKLSTSTSQWQVGLPGAAATQSPDAPLDYELRQTIKRGKAEIERLERALLDLEVEANLAGVPADWRE